MFSKLPDGPKGLMDIDSELHAPPVCLFIWGAFVFQCIIERVSKRFTMFLPEGIPVRATLSVTLKEYREVDIQVKEIELHSPDVTKRWTVKQGDSLWSIAARSSETLPIGGGLQKRTGSITRAPSNRARNW